MYEVNNKHKFVDKLFGLEDMFKYTLCLDLNNDLIPFINTYICSDHELQVSVLNSLYNCILLYKKSDNK